ncbi:hypothetical protein AHAS_Ahas16G0093900 [Arachis hypogaea]
MIFVFHHGEKFKTDKKKRIPQKVILHPIPQSTTNSKSNSSRFKPKLTFQPKPKPCKDVLKPSNIPTCGKNKKKVKKGTTTKSEKYVNATILDIDTDSYDSYKNAKDSLYQPEKSVENENGKGDSDSSVEIGKPSNFKKDILQEKHSFRYT